MSELKEYENEVYKLFVKELKGAGFNPYHYQGRFYYEGPAVNVSNDEFQKAIRSTVVQVQWEDMGMGTVIYPASDASFPVDDACWDCLEHLVHGYCPRCEEADLKDYLDGINYDPSLQSDLTFEEYDKKFEED